MARRSRGSVRQFMLVLPITVLTVAGARAPALAQETVPADAPYLNPALPVEQRVNDLISRMTLEEKASQMRDDAPGIARLKLPKYDWWSEAAHGVAAAGFATVFPQTIGLAATWDTPLIRRVGEAISTEGRGVLLPYTLPGW